MTTNPTDVPQDDDTQVLDAPGDGSAPADEPGDALGGGPEALPTGEETAAEELVITLGDEGSEDDDDLPAEGLTPKAKSAWARLRVEKTEAKRRARELELQLQQAQQRTAPAPVQLGEKPTLDSCDFDAEKLEAALGAWFERKQAVDAEQRRQQEANQAAQSAWNQRLQAFGREKAALPVSDFDEAELAVQEAFNVMQQGIMLKLPKAAKMVYALGKNKKVAGELAAIKDPVDFAFALKELEVTKLKETTRTAAPLPEKTVRGSSPGLVHGKKQLETMRAKAQETGDYTAYYAAKRRAEGRV